MAYTTSAQSCEVNYKILKYHAATERRESRYRAVAEDERYRQNEVLIFPLHFSPDKLFIPRLSH